MALGEPTQSAKDALLVELGAFIRRCRERIRPEELKLQAVGRRRTPGLRREELSQAAGVGLTWLTWLEQGRNINVSTDVLCAISRALHLTDDENAYLFTLAGLPVPKVIVTADSVPDHVLTIIDGIVYPACLLNYRLEVPHLNEIGARFFLFKSDTDGNVGRRVFLDSTYRALFEDIIALELLAVGILRLGWSRHPDDETLKVLLAELRGNSPRFEQLWSERHVMHPVEQRTVGFRHPDYGLLPFEAQSLLLNENADVSIYVAVPIEPQAMRRMLSS